MDKRIKQKPPQLETVLLLYVKDMISIQGFAVS